MDWGWKFTEKLYRLKCLIYGENEDNNFAANAKTDLDEMIYASIRSRKRGSLVERLTPAIAAMVGT